MAKARHGHEQKRLNPGKQYSVWPWADRHGTHSVHQMYETVASGIA